MPETPQSIISPKKIDIVILSYAGTDTLKKITSQCVESLLHSENPAEIEFNVIVIESMKSLKPFQYPGTKTIYPRRKFGYHRYMNIGIEMSGNPYVCICNNDLIFYPRWASEILKAFEKDASLMSASPACTVHHPAMGFELDSGNYYGYEVRKELIGWCILFKRSILKTTGKLDPGFKFWFADNDYSNTLKKHGIKHALITSSHVDHLESRTLKTKNDVEQRELTSRERFYYEYKWEGRSYFSYLNRLRKFYLDLRREQRAGS
jgi:GT2 family glycosyltransferase